MRSGFALVVFIIFCLTSFTLITFAQDNQLKSRAELTNFEETSRYDDVMRFITELQNRSDLARLETFGTSQEGRALPLMILADPPVATPREARASGKPVVFIFANIHAGEVEGKEAVQHLARRMLTGDLRSLLSKTIILLAPIYNADGNEKISMDNRTEQYGPVAGVGRRENAKGLDLNRDYMKLDSLEAQSLVRLMNRWDPHLTVDLHTTNGSYHGYHLTYSIPLNPASDARLIAFHREKMMPVIGRALLAQHKFRAYYYGNFGTRDAKTGEVSSFGRNQEGKERIWAAFTHAPRIGQNYVGLRNRLTILSEAYSYLSFKRRIEVTEAFVEEICKYAAAHAAEILQLAKQLDDDTIRRAQSQTPFQLGVEYQMQPLAKPVDILVGEVQKVKNPRSGKEMTAMLEDKFTPMKMLDYGVFAATRSVATPRAYLFKREDGMKAALEKLKQHGLVVEELTAPLTAEVESFTIDEVKRAQRAFQGHNEVRLKGQYKKASMTFPAGSLLVRMAQPLGTLAAYLLEPESDDGLTAWNFLDAYLEVGKPHPVFKLTQDAKIASRLLE
ncbi:MAG: M14 family metallopeptidase [Acidobacteriota bacterium]